jgi:sarcosine oxidase
MERVEVAVIGCGAVGSATLWHLARRGVNALAIDRFPPGHDRGSSHGETRVIRKAYFEHADYVPLLKRAYDLWAELESVTGQKLYTPAGLVEIGPPDGAVVPGVIASARQHGLPVEPMTAADVRRRWPSISVPDTMTAVFEPDAGYLAVEACVRAQAAAAQAAGGRIRLGAVASWRPVSSGGFAITLEDGDVIAADRLALAPGAWAPQLLADLAVPFVVKRKPLFWLATADRELERAPVWLFETPAGVYYGFPKIGGELKAAEHSHGETVADPLTVDRSLHADEEERLRRFLAAHLPSVDGPVTRHAVCMYTMTPDQDFIVDVHPTVPGVALIAGLSGHGFKFAPVLGEVLADLATAGRTDHPIGFLSARRPLSR